MKKTILMIGDSWGVPNYAGHSVNWPYTPPEVHTEFRLKKLGYDVFNYSLNGSSMSETIGYAMNSLKGVSLNEVDDWLASGIKLKRSTFPFKEDEDTITEIPIPNYQGQKIDWIVWFHTEALRDSVYHMGNLYKYLPLGDIHNMCLKGAYASFKELVEIAGPDVKTAIIGGQASVDKLLYDFHQPTFIIEDWRSELFNRDLPKVYTLSNVNWVDKSGLSTEEKLKIFEDHTLIMDLMAEHRDLFYDGCHPGEKPHMILTERLHQLFQSV